MSITYNNTALRTLKADSFNEDALYQYILCIKIGLNSVSFCALDAQDNECHFFEMYQVGAQGKVAFPFAELQHIVRRHAILSKADWGKVCISIADRKCTLVPHLLLGEDSVEYFRLNCEYTPAQEAIHQYVYPSLQTAVLFAVPNSLKTWAEKQYNTVHYLHANAGFLKGVLSLATSVNEGRVFGLLENNRATFAVVNQQKLRLLNSFECHAATDVLYYCLFVMSEVGISPKSAELVCWGNLDETDERYQLLREYVKQISLGKRPMHLRFASDFDAIPEQLEFDIFSTFDLIKA